MPTSLRPVVRPLVPCLVVAMLALAAGHAQEPTGGEPSLFTEDVVVSANLTETPLDEVGTSVTIIGAEEIAARDKSTLIELLRTVPGLTAVVQGGPGRVGSVLLRGGASSHTLVLLDGVRLNSAGTGAFDFADMPAENIERTEILGGPQSSLYGSEALAGVVNIVTKRARAGLHGAVRAEVGTESARRAAASIEGAGASAGPTASSSPTTAGASWTGRSPPCACCRRSWPPAPRCP